MPTSSSLSSESSSSSPSISSVGSSSLLNTRGPGPSLSLSDSSPITSKVLVTSMPSSAAATRPTAPPRTGSQVSSSSDWISMHAGSSSSPSASIAFASSVFFGQSFAMWPGSPHVKHGRLDESSLGARHSCRVCPVFPQLVHLALEPGSRAPPGFRGSSRRRLKSLPRRAPAPPIRFCCFLTTKAMMFSDVACSPMASTASSSVMSTSSSTSTSGSSAWTGFDCCTLTAMSLAFSLMYSFMALQVVKSWVCRMS